MTRQEDIKKLKLFYERKTPTFLKVKSLRDFKVFNGFIKEVSDEYIIFDDIKIKNYPIEVTDILFIDVSRYKQLQVKTDGQV